MDDIKIDMHTGVTPLRLPSLGASDESCVRVARRSILYSMRTDVGNSSLFFYRFGSILLGMYL